MDNDGFSISVNNNLQVSYSMPLHVPPCDKCHRGTLADDADVQVVGYHEEWSEDTGSEYEMPDYMCKDCRLKFNKTALTDYKKEDIGKRKTFVVPGQREIEVNFY